MKNINFKFNLPVNVLREGKKFVAYSPVLDLSTSGDSFEEVNRRFIEITKIFFEEIISKGTIDEVLSDLGWQKTTKEWQPPVLIAQQSESINVTSICHA